MPNCKLSNGYGAHHADLCQCGLGTDQSLQSQGGELGHVSGYWCGANRRYIGNDGYSWTPATISTVAGKPQAQPLTPTSGTTYQVTPLSADCILIAPDSPWGSQNMTVTFKASSAIASAVTPGPGETANQTVTCAPPGCLIASMPPPVQPSPLYTQPMTTPAPCATAASPAPAGVCAHG